MKSVLIVDDAAFMRKTVKDTIQRIGLSVIGEAENGIEAIERYLELKPDLVIMDITMPQMDGVEAVRNIRAIDKDARVIMCSAHGRQREVIASVKAGAKDFIVKPYSEERVAEAVRKMRG